MLILVLGRRETFCITNFVFKMLWNHVKYQFYNAISNCILKQIERTVQAVQYKHWKLKCNSLCFVCVSDTYRSLKHTHFPPIYCIGLRADLCSKTLVFLLLGRTTGAWTCCLRLKHRWLSVTVRMNNFLVTTVFNGGRLIAGKAIKLSTMNCILFYWTWWLSVWSIIVQFVWKYACSQDWF